MLKTSPAGFGGLWLLACEIWGRNALPGTGRKGQVAELSAAQVSEGCNGFSLLPALSFPGEHLEKIIPLIVQYCNVDDDELREYCFQAFESFVRRCVPLGNASAPSCASLSSWCKFPYVQHPGRRAFLQDSSCVKSLLHMQSWSGIMSCFTSAWEAVLLYCFAGVGVFLVLGVFLSQRELPCSWRELEAGKGVGQKSC